MDVPVQAILDALADQRNAALNELAQTKASLNAAMAEVGRLTEALEKATAKPTEGDS